MFICRDIGGGTLQWELINDDAATHRCRPHLHRSAGRSRSLSPHLSRQRRSRCPSGRRHHAADQYRRRSCRSRRSRYGGSLSPSACRRHSADQHRLRSKSRARCGSCRSDCPRCGRSQPRCFHHGRNYSRHRCRNHAAEQHRHPQRRLRETDDRQYLHRQQHVHRRQSRHVRRHLHTAGADHQHHASGFRTGQRLCCGPDVAPDQRSPRTAALHLQLESRWLGDGQR